MSKRPAPKIEPDLAPPRSLLKRFAILALILAGMPFLVEAGALCLAQWLAMLGRSCRPVDTPWLDRASDFAHLGFWMLRRTTNRSLADLPWEPSVVFIVGCALAILAAMPLRRGA